MTEMICVALTFCFFAPPNATVQRTVHMPADNSVVSFCYKNKTRINGWIAIDQNKQVLPSDNLTVC